jgi:uncharacterized membrane protein
MDTGQNQENQPKPVLYQRHAMAIVVTLALSALFFSLTSPTKLPAVFFIVAFILVFAASYGVATVIMYVAGFISGTLGQERFRPRIRAVKAIAAAIITVLLGLSSIGQLTAKDLLTLAVFFGLLYFYVTRLAQR